MPSFSYRSHRPRSQDVKTKKTGVTFTYRRSIKRRRIRRRLQTRPTPLLGLIYCRRLNMRCWATGRTAACHVDTHRRRASLLHIYVHYLQKKLSMTSWKNSKNLNRTEYNMKEQFLTFFFSCHFSPNNTQRQESFLNDQISRQRKGFIDIVVLSADSAADGFIRRAGAAIWRIVLTIIASCTPYLLMVNNHGKWSREPQKKPEIGMKARGTGISRHPNWGPTLPSLPLPFRPLRNWPLKYS